MTERSGSTRVAALPAIVALALPARLQAARVEIILDASGSMRASAGPMSRMEAGKRAVRTSKRKEERS